MASSPITSRQIDGKTVETVSDFIFLGSKITADGDCSHEIKTLTPWKESYDQLSILKNRVITLSTKGMTEDEIVGRHHILEWT